MRVIENARLLGFAQVRQLVLVLRDLECRGPARCSGPSASEAATKGPRHSKSRRTRTSCLT